MGSKEVALWLLLLAIVFLSNVLDIKKYITSQYTAHHQSFGGGGPFPLFVILCNWKSFLERMN